MISSALSAQKREEVAFSGVVVEALSGEPIPFASVWLYGRWDRVLSAVPADSSGRFSVKGIKEGKYKIAASFMRYMSDTVEIEYKGIAIEIGEIAVAGGVELTGATITDTLSIIRNYPDRMIYDVSMDPEAKRVKMMDIMQKIPSMRQELSNGKLSYMNMPVGTILIDGERHELISGSLQFPMTLIKGDVMSKIEVIEPGSPEYNNKGPLINIITARRIPNGYAAEINATASNKWSAGGGVNVVTKFLKDYIVGIKYNPGFSGSPKLMTNSIRESLSGEEVTMEIQQTKSAWSDAERHSLSLRSSAKLFGNALSFGLATTMSQNNSYSQTTDRIINFIEQSPTTQQNRESKNSSRTLPRLTADLQYSHKLPSKYNARYAYTYTDRASERNYSTERDHIPLQSSIASTGSTEHAASLSISRRGIYKHRIGGRISFIGRKYSNSSDYLEYNPFTQQYEAIEEQSYGLEYSQKVANGFVNYQYFSRKFLFSTGIGANWERDNGIFKSTGDTPLDYEHMRLSPSVKVNYNISKMFRINTSYFQQIVRPNIDRLNPYSDKSDPMNIKRGNPELKPELAHNISFGASVGRQPITKGVARLQFLYSLIDNAIEEVVTVDEEGVSTTSFYNLGKMQSAAVQIDHMQPQLLSWLSFNQTGVYTLYFFESGNPNVGSRRSSSFEYNAGLRAEFAKASSLYLSYTLRSSIGGAQSIKTNIYHYLNMSLSQTLIKDKLYGSITLSDPFSRRRIISRTIGSELFRQTVEQEQRGYIVGISLRFKFGRFKDSIKDEQIDVAGDRARATVGGVNP